jgi:hypothetical protein
LRVAPFSHLFLSYDAHAANPNRITQQVTMTLIPMLHPRVEQVLEENVLPFLNFRSKVRTELFLE